MKKRILALLLSVIMVVGLLPTTALAAGATGTWAVKLHVSENEALKYNSQNTIKLGFGVQSDDLKVKNAQGIVFAVDLTLFDFVYDNEGTAESYMDYFSETLTSDDLSAVVYENYTSGSGLSKITWSAKPYVAKKGDVGFMILQPAGTREINCTTEVILASVLLGLKSGKTVADIKADSIRLATKEEAKSMNQSQVIMITDGDKNTQEAIRTNGEPDTLTVAPIISWDGISVDDTPVTDSCTVTFEANGGSGTMDPVTVTKNTDGKYMYTTPARGGSFTAPAGKAFEVWEVTYGETTEEVPGNTEIELPGNITLRAKWGTSVTAANFTMTGYEVGKTITDIKVTPDEATSAVLRSYTDKYRTSFVICTDAEALDGTLDSAVNDDAAVFEANKDYYLCVELIAASDHSFQELTAANVKVGDTSATKLFPPVYDGCVMTYAIFKLDQLTVAHTHSFGTWVDEVPATCKTTGTKGHKDCTGCGKHFDNSDNEITDLSIPVDPNNHSFGTWVNEVPATCKTTGTKGHKDCTGCGKHFDNSGNEITDLSIPVDSTNHAEALGTTWKKNETHHWHEYPCCGAKADEAEHSYTDDADTTCNDCDYVRTVAHTHSFGTWVNEVPATCKTTGTKGHKDCSGCGKHFDADGNEITDLSIPVDPNNHSFGTWVNEVPATCKTTGTKGHKDCTGCGKHFDNSDNEITDLSIPVDSANHAQALDTTTWKKNETHHWHEYPCCGAKADEAEHSYTEGVCVCGATHKDDQTITADNVSATYGDTDATIVATAQTTLSYAVKSGSDVIEVAAADGKLTIKKAGTATVTVTAAETSAYNSATKDVTVTIAKKEIKIEGASPSPAGRPYEPGNFSVGIGSVSFSGTVDSKLLEKGTDYTATGRVENDNVGAWDCIVTVTLLGDAANNYTLKENPVTCQKFSIYQADPADPTGLTGKTGNKLSTVALPEGWAWVDGETIMTEGTQQYPVTYAGTDNYHSWTESNDHKLTVIVSDKDVQTITAADVNATYGDVRSISASTSGDGALSYAVTTGADVVDVAADGKLTIKKAGTATVTVTAAETATCAVAAKVVTVTVSRKDVTVAASNQSIKVNGTLPNLGAADAYTVSGLVNGDTASVSLAYAAAPDVTRAGSYDIIVTAAVDTDKYVLTTVNGKLTIADDDFIYVPPFVAPTTPASTYSITVAPAQNGAAAADRRNASAGTTVTITVAPSKGYELEALTVLDANGRELPLGDAGNGKYTFQMPASNVTIAASFAESNAMLNFFVDVPADAYYAEAVLWAAENGITGGVDDVHFAPDASCTRAQIVTFLWRAAGSPEPQTTSDFTDVPAAAYYAKAVAWAVENGITGGIGGGKFAPDATCTRAQAVTFLWRAAGSPAVDQLTAFGDVAEEAYYAKAVAWAAENGITGGIGGGLFGSDDNCTRAQIVTFLYRSMK